MKPYYEEAGITIYHGDCRGVAPALGNGYAIVSDPPYGIGWRCDQRFSGGTTRRGSGSRHETIAGDTEPFDPTVWLEYPEVILWGANHFWGLLPAGTALVWQKRNLGALGTFLSDAEIAFFNRGRGVYLYVDTFAGCRRAIEAGRSADAPSAHPNQKPLGLMSWCIGKTEGAVLDPFMGSGTTLRAAKDLGRKAIGIEIEERYCEIAADRLRQAVLFGAEATA